MLLDKKMKRKLFVVLFVAAIAEIFVLLPLVRGQILQLPLWRVTLGSLATITGITLFYVILILPFDEKDKRLRLVILANPSATMILSGIGVVIWDNPSFDWLFIICSFGAVICFLISFILLIRHFVIAQRSRS